MSLLFAPRFRRAISEKTVICLFSCLYQVLSHILGVSLPPSACSNPLCRHPPPSSEGGEGTPVPCTELDLLSKLGVNAVTGRGYNPSVFSACETSRKSSSPYTGEPRRLPPQSHRIAKAHAAVKLAVGGLPSSVTVQRSAQHRATFPKGKAKAALESQTPQREPRRRARAAVRPPLPRCETQHYNPSVFLRPKGVKIQLPLHRGAKNALSHFCALFRIPN